MNLCPRHPQTQGVVERSNADLKKKLQIWMKENKSTNWSKGVRFVQWQMNTIYHRVIRGTPYNALFGNSPRCGIANKIPGHFLHQIGCCDIREEILEALIQDDQNLDSGLSENSDSLTEMIEDDDTHSEIPGKEETYLRVSEDDYDSLNFQPPSEIDSENEHPTKKPRRQAKARFETQAEEMLGKSTRRLRSLSPGVNVAVPVSKFDRSNAQTFQI